LFFFVFKFDVAHIIQIQIQPLIYLLYVCRSASKKVCGWAYRLLGESSGAYEISPPAAAAAVAAVAADLESEGVVSSDYLYSEESIQQDIAYLTEEIELFDSFERAAAIVIIIIIIIYTILTYFTI
jgi:hypothetical protein